MRAIPPAREAYPVPPRPLVKAEADTMGVVEGIHPVVPTAMAREPGTMVLGLSRDTFRGRSPWSRVPDAVAQPETARLFGTALPAAACHDDTGGRGLERLSDPGTIPRCTAWAVRADQGLGLAKRSVHCETPSVRVDGASLPPEDQPAPAPEVPVTRTQGESQATRPALQRTPRPSGWRVP